MQAEPQTAYPVAVTAEFAAASRWLWIVKWFLAIPHYLVLLVLWCALVLSTVGAGIVVLVTGRYPRVLFEFAVGVLRWSWRVRYYTFPVNGTDRYPPFTLTSRSDYPADLAVAHPVRLARWPVPIKWWLLAIPHYLIVRALRAATVIVALVAAIALLCTGTYPRGLYDLLVGKERWVYRVAAYALLLRDEYPPLRLDQGATEPDTVQLEAANTNE